MKLGVHMRIAGRGLDGAARMAAEIGCETVQIFAANPSAWRSAEIRPEIADNFRRIVNEAGISPVFIHTPYLLNLASPDPDIYARSTTALADSMARAELLGAGYVVTHIGSHRGSGIEQGVVRICEATRTALAEGPGTAVLLLENSAGSGDSVGSKFSDLALILDCMGECLHRLGICLDTAHLWGAGYDVSDHVGVHHVMAEFDSVVGIRYLRLMHLNDTRVRLGARVDRHANIGTGNIGEQGFFALLHHPSLRGLPGIIETPARGLEDDIRDIDVLKRLREEQ